MNCKICKPACIKVNHLCLHSFILLIPFTHAFADTISSDVSMIKTTLLNDQAANSAASAAAYRQNALAVKAAKDAETAQNRTILYKFLQPSNPSLQLAELERMSDEDVRKLFYNFYRANGKSIGEAHVAAASVAIPPRR